MQDWQVSKSRGPLNISSVNQGKGAYLVELGEH